MLFLTQFRFELLKLFARKRTYIGFGAFLAMELLVLFMANRPGPRMHFRHLIEQNGYGFEEYFSGTTLALMIVHWTAMLLGSLYLALIAGDLMAKEIEDGTMRMLLCRPVSRVRVAVLKYFSSIAYTLALILFIGGTALATGFAYRGYGGLFVAPEEGTFAMIPAAKGLMLYIESIPLLGISMISISSIGFLFSCCNMKPAAASIITVSVIILDSIFHGVPFFESLRPFFITTHLGSWTHLFESYPPLWRMTKDYTYLLGLDLTCLIVGAAIFLQRDLK